LSVASGSDKNSVTRFGVIDRALDFRIIAGSVLGHNNGGGSRRGFKRERERRQKQERSIQTATHERNCLFHLKPRLPIRRALSANAWNPFGKSVEGYCCTQIPPHG